MLAVNYDFSLIVEGLVATGMRQVEIARRMQVSPGTVCHWRQGNFAPKTMKAMQLLELAEEWTDKQMEKMRNCDNAMGKAV